MKYKSKHEKNTGKSISWPVICLTALLLVTVSVTVWALFFRSTAPVLAPDYAPQQTEEHAEPMSSDGDGEKLQQQQGGGAVSLSYSREVTIDLSEKTARLMFANPGKSNQNMVLQMVVQDTVIVQSGLLTPGHQVTRLNLLDRAKLSSGRYNGKLVVLYYQSDTGEKAMLHTEIPITITVEE